MKVKAKSMGQYKGRMMERGDVFQIESEKEFSRHWMEKIEEPKPEVSESKEEGNESSRD